MAFFGAAILTQASDRIVRIIGLSLPAGAGSGTIGLAGFTGTPPDVRLPAAFKTEHYAYLGKPVPLVDAIEVTYVPNTSFATAVPISIVKTGTTVGDFRITFQNDSVGGSPQFEIMIKYHD
jgi:hypothetical protein